MSVIRGFSTTFCLILVTQLIACTVGGGSDSDGVGFNISSFELLGDSDSDANNEPEIQNGEAFRMRWSSFSDQDSYDFEFRLSNDAELSLDDLVIYSDRCYQENCSGAQNEVTITCGYRHSSSSSGFAEVDCVEVTDSASAYAYKSRPFFDELPKSAFILLVMEDYVDVTDFQRVVARPIAFF